MSHKDLQWADLDKLYKEVLKRSLDLSDHPCVLYDAISFPRRKCLLAANTNSIKLKLKVRTKSLAFIILRIGCFNYSKAI